MAKKLSHDHYMKIVGAKINASKRDLLKSGNRDTLGFAFSAERIRKSAENLFFQFSDLYNDPVSSIYKGFSEQPGIGNVGRVAGIDVVDVNIEATNQSILGYLSAERGMDKPIDTLWFQGLKALQENGDYKANAWVNHPYTPMSSSIRKSLRGAFVEAAVTSGAEIKLDDLVGEGGHVLTETIQVIKVENEGTATEKRTVVGKVVDGELMFNDGISTATLKDNVVTITTSGSGYKVVAGVDKTTEQDGKNTLKLKPAVETIQIVAQPRRIQLQQSYEESAFMNKQSFNLSQTGVALNKILISA